MLGLKHKNFHLTVAIKKPVLRRMSYLSDAAPNHLLSMLASTLAFDLHGAISRQMTSCHYLGGALKVIFPRYNKYMQSLCVHLSEAPENVKPNTPEGCEECLKTGDTWVHLRLCLTCGHVGCCDSSKNRHATKHFEATKHPVIKSFEPGEDWIYCYIDDLMAE
jgi:hypothetical protein